MSDDSEAFEDTGAELLGLPYRPQSSGRETLEEIASDFLQLLREGKNPSIDEFSCRHPTLAADLKEFLPIVAAMEDWKSHRTTTNQTSIPNTFEISHLGEFRIIREIARGGMGVVFEAEQPSLNRRVAVKLLPSKITSHSRWAEQFQSEARIAAHLQHPNIVPVFSLGTQDDRYYYVMQLISGVGLDKLIDSWNRDHGIVSMDDLIEEYHPKNSSVTYSDQRVSKRILRQDSWIQIAKIALQIASALRFAHRSGILHRDIKPANLLIDHDGKIWVTDFGLALGREMVIDGQNDSLAGTLRFMAPEQFRKIADQRSDIYALGATLYELCTLRRMFTETKTSEIIATIEKGAFVPPRQVNREIPPALEKIILRCLETNPDRRYQAVNPLHSDLIRFINTCEKAKKKSWWHRLFGE
ncbi:serine/threonine protein kinase [Planctomicrobium sp. SH668]|uniref:serine/threonine protein kinase n=1 Tax=Planctomicrobium sp. SH668 TaxID=3448126 RepID=UPI003F5CAEB6